MTLHSPLFLSRKNFGKQIDSKADGPYVSYQPHSDKIYIEYNGTFAFSQTYDHAIPVNPDDLGYIMQGKEKTPQVVTNVTHAQVFGSSKTAQVADPTGVFKPLVK